MITLTLKEQPKVPLEAETLAPDVLAPLAPDAIRALPVHLGKRRLRVDDFFEVEGAAGDELEIRGDAARVKWIGRGMTRGRISVLGNVGMAIHHKLCHTLGGTFNLPHAETHTVVLPHAMEFNRGSAPDAMRIAAEALGVQNAAQGVYDLAARLGAPLALKDIGMPADGLDRAAKLATENPYYNPRPIEYSGVRQLLENAYYGKRPA